MSKDRSLATLHIGSDRYPYKVIYVSPQKKKIIAQAMKFVLTYSPACPTEQNATIKEDLGGKKITAYADSKGKYYFEGSLLSLGKAEAYRDPDF